MSPGRQKGFTLVELLTVVAIIGILSALAIPEISEAMRNRRQNAAAVHVLDVYRVARARALGRGVAQMVRWRAIGTVEHWEGDTNGCSTTNWDVDITTTEFAAPTHLRMLVERFDTRVNEYAASGITTDRFSVVGSAADGGVGPFADLCFSPLGRVYFRTAVGAALLEAPLAVNGGYQIRIRRRDLGSGAVVGVDRFVVIPDGGTPRLQVLRRP